MEINGINESAYHAVLLDDYKISSAPVESNYWQGRNHSSFALLSQSYGLKKISLNVVFDGRDAEDVALNKSRFDAALWGKVEIHLPNGFTYTSILDDAGDLERIGNEKGRSSYELLGVQHKPLVTINSGTFTCASTVPFTDCIITATATAVLGSIGDIDFSSVTVGDVLKIDGINKRLLVNDVDAATNFDWIDFPVLVPGNNTVSTSGVSGLSIQYYPTFM